MARKEEPVPEEVPGDTSTYYEETVVIEHPDLENSKTTMPRVAFDEVWAEKGWVISEAEEVPPPDQGQGSEAAS